MADIEALKFGESVKSSNDLLGQTLKEKGIEPSSSLLGKVQQVSQLSENEDRYIPDPFFDKMEEEFANDPLRKENGGDYDCCVYVVLTKLADTAYIPHESFEGASSTNPYYFMCSDGQTFTKTSHSSSDSFTITFNDKNTEDMKLQTGEYIRWIKVYVKDASSSWFYNPVLTCLTSANERDCYHQQTIFLVTDSVRDTYPNDNARYNFTSAINLRYMIIFNSTSNISMYYMYHRANLECLKFKNPDNLTVKDMPLYVNYTNARIVGTTQDYLSSMSKLKSDLDLTNFTGTFDTLSIFPKYVLGNKIKPKVLSFYSTGNYEIYTPRLDVDFLRIDYADHSILEDNWDISIRIMYLNSMTKLLEKINNLKDFSDTTETRTLTIPSSYLTLLAPEIIAEANRKGWTVTGA